ncbi:MAG TPA: tetratricopeptide repeat protein [Bryobacteraceae bacterium]|nr:tetratricopeptide repeat protein [Bryobacteraceae bacterium]
MSPEQWRRIEQVFHGAREQAPGAQAAFLAEACRGDDELRREVESLLAQEDVTGPADRPVRPEQMFAGSHDGSTLALPDGLYGKPAAGSIIGRYRILRTAGQGGMGTVYEAEQDHPRRVVALKIIKPGLTAEELIKRFELESQALGRLQHPGIAQIYEGGTTDAGCGPQPYFAMEFIRGEDLKSYANRHSLDTRARLELTIKICQAVEHAHQHGIIHRDLKPGNILVDETGQPKIVDFGVARVTDSDAQITRQTDVGQLVGTLAYMSPEQVAADPLGIDTRSDVYALGVVLYELLSGRLPYTVSRKLHEAVRTIREEDPASLSSVNRNYRGDIETIVMRALEKDKNRRYASAAALAADIQRYLRYEPITARPASAIYQLRKFTRRHRALVAGLMAVFVALIAGVVASATQAMRARNAERAAVGERDRAAAAERRATAERDRALSAEGLAQQQRNNAMAERQRADTEAATAKAVADFLQNDLLAQAGATAQARAGIPGDPDLKVRTALDRAAAKIGGHFDKQPLVEASILQTMGRAYQDLGVFPEARKLLERSIALRRQAGRGDDQEMLGTMSRLADIYRFEGKYDHAVDLFRKTIEAQTRLLGARHPDTLETTNNLAVAYLAQSKHAEAERLFRRVLDLQRQTLGQDALATLRTANNLGFLYETTARFDEAEKLYSKTYEALRRLRGEQYPDTLDALTNLGSLYVSQGKFPQAEAIFTKLLEIRRRVQGEEHPRTVEALNNLAQTYRMEGQLAKAEELQLQVVELMKRTLGEEHPDTLTSINNLALTYRDEGKYAESEPLLQKTLAVRKRTLGADHRDTLRSMAGLARLYDYQGRYKEEQALTAEVYALRRRLLGDDHPDTLESLNVLGASYVRLGEYAKAEPVFQKLIETRRRISGPDHAETLIQLQNLAVVYRSQCKYAAAEELVKKVLDVRRRVNGDRDPDTLRSVYSLGVLYRYEGNYAAAEPLFQEALLGQTQVLGAEHIHTFATMQDLGENYRAQGQYARAEELFAKVLDGRRRVLPAAHPDTTGVMASLGAVKLQQGKPAAAEPLLREALDRYEKAAPESWARFETQCMLGASLSGRADYTEGEALLLAGYDRLMRWKGVVPVDGPRTLEQGGQWLVGMYEKWGKPGKAAEWRDRIRAAPVRRACEVM